MKLNKRKGFTIVELVIVIAVIAILAAVLIPNISNLVKKANASADESLVRNLNTALSMDVEKHQTMDAALEAALKNGGYELTTIVTKNMDNKILWDSKNDCFVYMKKGASKPTYLPNTQEVKDVKPYDYFEILNELPADGKIPDSQTYSVYLAGESTIPSVTTKVGLDVGKNTVGEVTFTNDKKVSVLINTNGGKLTVDASEANVTHRGDASIVTIEAVAKESYHENGKVNEIKLKAGRVVVEAKAEVGSVLVTAAAATGVKVEVKDSATLGAVGAKNFDISKESGIITGADKTTVVTGTVDNSKFAGGFGTEKAPYLIADLQGFKNISSNSGKYFKMIADVDLGVLTKDLLSSFRGTFDGNGHVLTVKSTTGAKSVITKATDAKFMNLIINTENVTFVSEGYGWTYFINVDVKGSYSTTQSSNESAYLYFFFGTDLQFIDCDASYDLTGDSYQAIFLGGYVQNCRYITNSEGKKEFVTGSAYNVNVLFKNLTYSGTAKSSLIALLAGNSSTWLTNKETYGLVTLTVSNCVNNGVLVSNSSTLEGNIFCAKETKLYQYDSKGVYSSNRGSFGTIQKLDNITPTYNVKDHKFTFEGVTNDAVRKVLVKASTRADFKTNTSSGDCNYYVIYQTYDNWSTLSIDAKFASKTARDNAFVINDPELNKINLLGDDAVYSTTADTIKVTYTFLMYDENDQVIGYSEFVVNPY